MAINADKPKLWKADVAKSVDQFNTWFIGFAPQTFQEERAKAADVVEAAIVALDDFFKLSPTEIAKHPEVITVLRMSTAPPIARDRLIGLAHVKPGLLTAMEKGVLPRDNRNVAAQLKAVGGVIDKLLDRDLFPWLEGKRRPTKRERELAAVIVGDRLTGAVANPLIRNAQEARQLRVIDSFLTKRGYTKRQPPAGQRLTAMTPGTFAFRMIVVVGKDTKVNIPVDVVIQRKKPAASGLPILVEAKSAGDYTNTNKRRKEEATKMRQLVDTFGADLQLILFLCGYFDTGYLGYEAAEGLDWVWEHRVEDFLKLGL